MYSPAQRIHQQLERFTWNYLLDSITWCDECVCTRAMCPMGATQVRPLELLDVSQHRMLVSTPLCTVRKTPPSGGAVCYRTETGRVCARSETHRASFSKRWNQCLRPRSDNTRAGSVHTLIITSRLNNQHQTAIMYCCPTPHINTQQDSQGRRGGGGDTLSVLSTISWNGSAAGCRPASHGLYCALAEAT